MQALRMTWLRSLFLAVTLALGLAVASQPATVTPAKAACGSHRVICLGGNLPSLARLYGFTTDCNGKTGVFFGQCNITVSRASTAYEDDQSGNWIAFGPNVTRLTNRGWLFEEQRTNSIRNSTNQGAVVGALGSGGALPTNWANGSQFGLVVTVVGTGTQLGLSYIDISISGQSTSGFFAIRPDDSVTAAYGQTWSTSGFLALVSGTLTNITNVAVYGQEQPSATNFGTISTIVPTSTLTRVSSSGTLSQSNTVNLRTIFQINMTANQNVSATFRLAMPQAENNTGIFSTVASAATSTSGTGGVNGSAIYQVGGGGAIAAATLNVTWTAGVMTVNSVASAGSYTTFPPSPASLTYVSGTATGWTGATVTLTPTNLSSRGFASSPIPTTNAAVTRAADATVPFTQTYGDALTQFLQFTPETPAAGFFGYGMSAFTGSAVTPNSVELLGSNGALGELIGIASNSVVVSAQTLAAIPQNTSTRLCGTTSVAGPFTLSRDGATQSSGSGTGPTGASMTELIIGTSPNTATPLNGHVERYGLNPNTALSATQCNAITSSTFQ